MNLVLLDEGCAGDWSGLFRDMSETSNSELGVVRRSRRNKGGSSLVQGILFGNTLRGYGRCVCTCPKYNIRSQVHSELSSPVGVWKIHRLLVDRCNSGSRSSELPRKSYLMLCRLIYHVSLTNFRKEFLQARLILLYPWQRAPFLPLHPEPGAIIIG